MAASPSSGSRPVALVTGAARRIGRAIALHLAARGWSLAVHHRSGSDEARHEAEATAADIRATGAACVVLAADLADEAATRALVPAAVQALGQLDAVVNNASLFVYDDAHTTGPAAMERHWRTNTAAPVLLAQALHAHLLARGAQGCVVNLLDQKLANRNPDYFSYTLSKAALAEATMLLAQALAPVLRVCAVAPGITTISDQMTEAEFAAAHRLVPLQRSSTPGDIAAAVAYLLQAPSVTGHTLFVDGGQHLLGQPRDVLFLAGGSVRRPQDAP